MPRSLRVATLIVCTLLWLSGCAWMLLHYFFQVSTDFGPGPNPWEPFAIRVHGVIAIATVFLLGWITSRHIIQTWHVRWNHVSGIVLTIVCLVQILSGYSLYYLADAQLQIPVAVLHQVIGVSAIIFSLVHWHRPSRSDRNRGQVLPQPRQ
jgi:hypothetical protein